MTELLFSVIIPTYQRPELLSACLECLKPEVQALDANYEVIVTDDGQSVLAQGMIAEHYPWVRWVAGPQHGPAANRNNGIQAARGDWLVFTDDDCLPDRGWLKAFKKVIDCSPKSFILEGKTYADREKRSMAENSPINDLGGNLWSCNMAVHSRVMRAVGGFDERYPYAMMEDVDLRLRLTEAGYTLKFLPEATVCHPWREVKNFSIFKKRIFSMQLFWSLHPQQRPNFSQHLGILGRILVKDQLPGLLHCRGVGFQYVFWDVLYYLKLIYLEFKQVKYDWQDGFSK